MYLFYSFLNQDEKTLSKWLKDSIMIIHRYSNDKYTYKNYRLETHSNHTLWPRPTKVSHRKMVVFNSPSPFPLQLSSYLQSVWIRELQTNFKTKFTKYHPSTHTSTPKLKVFRNDPDHCHFPWMTVACNLWRATARRPKSCLGFQISLWCPAYTWGTSKHSYSVQTPILNRVSF